MKIEKQKKPVPNLSVGTELLKQYGSEQLQTEGW